MRRAIRWTLSILVLLLVADYWLYPRFATAPTLENVPLENAIWLRYKWYFAERRRDSKV